MPSHYLTGLAGPGAGDPRANVMQGLLARGFPQHVAEGIANEINRESGFDPTINEINPVVPGSRGGFGLFQHTGPRRRELEAFAQAGGVPVGVNDTQLDFFQQELDTTETRTRDALAQTTNAEEAADVFKRMFLRPLSTQSGPQQGGILGAPLQAQGTFPEAGGGFNLADIFAQDAEGASLSGTLGEALTGAGQAPAAAQIAPAPQGPAIQPVQRTNQQDLLSLFQAIGGF